jgi:hypothetical protein
VFTCRCSISATSDAVSSFPTSFVIIGLGSFRQSGIAAELVGA